MPRSVADLLKLPGVGRYAASATAATAFGADEAVVDGVSARVYRRYFGLTTTMEASADEELWDLVREIARRTPDKSTLNWAALDLAATICLPRVPRCSSCPLLTECAWPS